MIHEPIIKPLPTYKPFMKETFIESGSMYNIFILCIIIYIFTKNNKLKLSQMKTRNFTTFIAHVDLCLDA